MPIAACFKPHGPVQESASTSEPGLSKILFLNYKISASGVSGVPEKVICLSYFIVPGNLKAGHEPGRPSKTSKFACLLETENGALLKKIEVENPLVQTQEYVNDAGQLEQKELKIDETEFSLRTTLPFQAKRIKFVKYSDDGKPIILHSIQLTDQ